MKYVSLVLLGLLIAVLAGCGGGGDGGKGDKITELTADLELVQADLKKAQAELATTKGRLTTTQGDLSTTKETLTTTQGDLSKTKETLTTTQGDLSKTKGTLTTTQETLTTTKGELAITKETLSTTQSDLATTKETLTTTKETLTTTQETLTTTEASLTDAQSELKTAKASLTDAQSELATTRTTLETAEASLTTLMAKAGVDTVAALNTELDDYVTLQYKVDALLFQFDVDDLEDLRDKLKTDTGLQAEVNALLTATGQTTLAALETAYTTAKTMNTQAQAVLTATDTTTLTAAVAEIDRLKKAETSLTNRLNTANQNLTDAQGKVAAGTTDAEANARARSLLTNALTTGADETTRRPFATTGVVPTVTVPSSGTLSVKASDYQTSSLSAPSGFKAYKLTRTVAGSQYTIVAYTDREVNRSPLDHYGAFLSDKSDKQINLSANPNTITSQIFDVTESTNFHDHTNWKITHSFSSTTTAADPADKESTSYDGSFQGVSGSFNCGSDCKVTLSADYTPTYNASATPLPTRTLSTVNVSVPTGKTLYFKPTTTAINLSETNTNAAFSGGDKEYVLFGWWKYRPAVAAGVYDFQVFAQIPGSTAWSGTPPGTATYDGPAVGVYVEQGSLTGNTGLARHGEFTATVHLNAAGNTVTGYVDSFRAAPEGSSSDTPRSWHLNLKASNAVSFQVPSGATTTTGEWEHTFVDKHTHSRLKQPGAIVGRFDAAIANTLHVTGAFGAHRRSTDQTE